MGADSVSPERPVSILRSCSLKLQKYMSVKTNFPTYLQQFPAKNWIDPCWSVSLWTVAETRWTSWHLRSTATRWQWLAINVAEYDNIWKIWFYIFSLQYTISFTDAKLSKDIFTLCCQRNSRHINDTFCTISFRDIVFVSHTVGTRGQSNLTKSTSRGGGGNSPVRGHPRGSKVVPLNSWGRVSY